MENVCCSVGCSDEAVQLVRNSAGILTFLYFSFCVLLLVVLLCIVVSCLVCIFVVVLCVLLLVVLCVLLLVVLCVFL